MSTNAIDSSNQAGDSGRKNLRRGRSTAFALALCLAAAAFARAQAAPTLTSVTPNNGAQDVPLTSTLVFVFSEAMSTEFGLIPSVPPFIIGNFEIGPAGEVPLATGTWSDDARTLTCEFSDALPANTTVTWKLNPAGALFPFANEGGTPLATTSGSFTTGAGGGGGGNGPKLLSVQPLDDAVNVSVSTNVVFVFDLEMQKNTQLNGFPPAVPGAILWGGPGVTASKFTYSWSADGKTLTCEYTGDLPGNTIVTWVLNPAGGTPALRLESEAGVAVDTAAYSGSFTTGAGSGGGGCDPDGVPDTWGSYTLAKSVHYVQTSSADPTPLSEDPFAFGAFVRGPQAGPAATAGSLTLPDASSRPLQEIFGFLSFSDTPASEAALDAAYPAGSYTLRFTQTGQPERVVAMTMPALVVPVPKVANFAAAQAINAAQDFSLSWNVFTGAGASDYLSLTITDGVGNILFQAPDPCVPRPLPASATSIVIPANTLPANQTLTGSLSFGRAFYSNTNAVPEMAGFGGMSRHTEFTLKTGAGGGPADPARFTGFRLLPNGNPQMDLTGSASRTYTIQRAGSLLPPNWNPAGDVTMDGTGKAGFEDTQAGKVLPLFYRAVAN